MASVKKWILGIMGRIGRANTGNDPEKFSGGGDNNLNSVRDELRRKKGLLFK